MIKYECCWTCNIQYVEGREERWRSGWRPNKEGAEKRERQVQYFKHMKEEDNIDN